MLWSSVSKAFDKINQGRGLYINGVVPLSSCVILSICGVFFSKTILAAKI